MPRIVFHNHMTRSVGRFRATAPAHDHGPGGCHCGGSCDTCKDDGSTKAELGIDVTYSKGSMTETRHYTVPGIAVDPRGHGPQPAGVVSALRRQAGHRQMVQGGWSPDRVEGYYKREQRDVGKRV